MYHTFWYSNQSVIVTRRAYSLPSYAYAVQYVAHATFASFVYAPKPMISEQTNNSSNGFEPTNFIMLDFSSQFTICYLFFVLLHFHPNHTSFREYECELLIYMGCEKQKHKKSTINIKILQQTFVARCGIDVGVCIIIQHGRILFPLRILKVRSCVAVYTEFIHLNNFELLVRAYVRACVERVFKELFFLSPFLHFVC